MNVLSTLKAKLLRAFAKRMKAKFTYDAAQYPLRLFEEKLIPTAWGPARALFYWPQAPSSEPLPVYLNLHGGGFVAGVPEHDDSYCRRLAPQPGLPGGQSGLCPGPRVSLSRRLATELRGA
ncbi:hypothetical protein PSH91_15195 [Pseudomonas sp. FP1154]|uniref:hypothetical protein n=1 Tax=Pseudomonas sp. FP1154 TaxID=2954077 RepID=UPI00273628F0|nr:hypothetical protein [Pseudomonas sp. FP1154]WLG21124.1 hypothetical protein PSH91_15195 [Pseudomonas sp. FP1154]